MTELDEAIQALEDIAIAYDGYRIPEAKDALENARERIRSLFTGDLEGEYEYSPGHRWIDRNGEEHWFVGNGVIAPGYVEKYKEEGGEVIRRHVGEWEVA